jgi:hypothetical protein
MSVTVEVTDVSEEDIAFILKVQDSSVLKKEAACSSRNFTRLHGVMF